MDKITKALALNKEVRVFIANTTQIANTALELHDLWPSSASVFSKVLTLGVLMGNMLKGDDALTIKINGNGPIGNIIVDANASGQVRGFVDGAHVNFINNDNILDDKTTIGLDGFIEVIKSQNLKSNFSSSIAIQTGDLAKDFTYYFYKSEQTPSIVLLSLNISSEKAIKNSAGVIIQVLPDAKEETLDFLESKFSTLKDTSSILSKSAEEILRILFKEDFEILEETSVAYTCGCSKDNFAKGLKALSKPDLESIIKEDEKAEIVCNYCKKEYIFSKEELTEILNSK